MITKKGGNNKALSSKKLRYSDKPIRKISFNSFPVPYLQIENIGSNLYSKSTNLKIGKLIIYPKLFSIYNFNNFHSRKIQLENNFVKTDLKILNLYLKISSD